MSELLIELFTEEMPPNLQISARTQFKKLLNEEIFSLNLKYFESFGINSDILNLPMFFNFFLLQSLQFALFLYIFILIYVLVIKFHLKNLFC